MQPFTCKKVAWTNFAEPCFQLLKIVLNLLQLGEGKLLKGRFTLKLGKKCLRMLGQLAVFIVSVVRETLPYRCIFLRPETLRREHKRSTALPSYRSRDLTQKVLMFRATRQHPCAIGHSGCTRLLEAAPRRYPRT
ncbi:MAG: hypothetical protein ABS35_20495 [Kaistia sp. SCN 65-12]|nr:MAG: hypothetical protein ABS35_20495 [Kaistia sp. SCN 65-12]